MQLRDGYFDMHCHILPQVDDGSGSLKESLAMIQTEYGQGVRHILLTPHYEAGCGRAEDIQERYEELKEKAAEQYQDLELLLGNELMYSDAIVGELSEGKAHTLNETDYVLVEFPISISWKDMLHAFRRLSEYGYRPILAHMERFQCLDRHMDRVDALISQGVYMQMNASSVAGGLFDRQAAYCRNLVADGRIHLLGTDAHSMGWRPPDMETAVQVLQRKIKKKEVLTDLLYGNPVKILRNEFIED